MTRSAFELDRLRAGIDKFPGSRRSLLRRVVSVNWHIGHEQCLFYPASHRAGVMQHLFQRHTGGVLVTKHHHA